MTIVEAQADSIGLHGSQAGQPDEMVHSFTNRRTDGSFNERFDFEPINQIDPGRVLGCRWNAIRLSCASNLHMTCRMQKMVGVYRNNACNPLGLRTEDVKAALLEGVDKSDEWDRRTWIAHHQQDLRPPELDVILTRI